MLLHCFDETFPEHSKKESEMNYRGKSFEKVVSYIRSPHAGSLLCRVYLALPAWSVSVLLSVYDSG